MKDNIYIIGAGAIGKALAVFLRLENRPVFILRGSVDDESIRSENISVELPGGARVSAAVEVGTLSGFARLDGIVVLASKSYGNDSLSQKLKGRTGNSPLVILQNGLGVERPFIDENYPRIYRCVLFATSQIVSASKISLIA